MTENSMNFYSHTAGQDKDAMHAKRVLSNHLLDSETTLEFERPLGLLSIVGDHLRGTEQPDSRLILDGFLVTNEPEYERNSEFTSKTYIQTSNLDIFCNSLANCEFKPVVALLSPLVILQRSGAKEMRRELLSRSSVVGAGMATSSTALYAPTLGDRAGQVKESRIIQEYWSMYIQKALALEIWRARRVDLHMGTLMEQFNAPPEIEGMYRRAVGGGEFLLEEEEVRRHAEIIYDQLFRIASWDKQELEFFENDIRRIMSRMIEDAEFL